MGCSTNKNVFLYKEFKHGGAYHDCHGASLGVLGALKHSAVPDDLVEDGRAYMADARHDTTQAWQVRI